MRFQRPSPRRAASSPTESRVAVAHAASTAAFPLLYAAACSLAALLLAGCTSGNASDNASDNAADNTKDIATADSAVGIAPLASPVFSQAAPTGAATLANAPDQFVSVGPVRLRYRVIGEGAPVLLLHGFSDRIEMWSGTADSLARNFKVIVPDLRGFGESSTPAGVAQYGRHMMTDLISLLDSAAVEHAHVVGYSMGGLLAAQLALDFPQRVSSLTFAAGVFYADSNAARAEIEPHAAAIERGEGMVSFMRFILPTWPDTLITSISEQLLATNERAVLVDVLRSIPSLTLDWSRQRDSRIPAIALAGTADPVFPHAQRVSGRWTDVELMPVANRDHVDIVYAPELIDAVKRHARR